LQKNLDFYRYFLNNYKMRATRASIHLDKYAGNILAVKERVGGRLICAAVKADAYGHGATAIARASLEAGAACFGVSAVREGEELREEGITAPILLFSPSLPAEIPQLIENRLTPFVSDGEYAGLLEKAAASAGIRLPVHLKFDTGMGRIGCTPEEAPELARRIAACPSLEYAGTATHLAVADSAAPDDLAYTEKQLDCFKNAVDAIRTAGVDPGIVHAANSGAVILHPGSWFDMVRPGILLYGYKTVGSREWGVGSGGNLPPLQVQPVMELRTNVVLIKRVKKGEAVSYGRTWVAKQDTEIAVLPVGYADGLPRLASGKWQAFINGKAYPMVGRICMDQCMVDIGAGGEVRRWDEAVIFGGVALGADELAERIGMIPYEITCNINKRVPRVYQSS
jgi:alanine racemase